MLLFKTHKIPPPFILLNFNLGIAILCLKTRASPRGGGAAGVITPLAFKVGGQLPPSETLPLIFKIVCFCPPAKLQGVTLPPNSDTFLCKFYNCPLYIYKLPPWKKKVGDASVWKQGCKKSILNNYINKNYEFKTYWVSQNLIKQGQKVVHKNVS